MDKVREIALKTLYKIDKEQAYSNIALDETIKENRNKIDERDIGFISEIVYGVTTWRLTIDEIIKKYSKIRLKKISPWILNILRMGIYQIVFLDKVPKSASVNESVNLAKRYGHKSSSNFVNAILRKVDKNDYKDFFDIKDDIERVSKTTSMPVWIIEELLKDNNIKKVEEICRCSNIRPKVTIRVNDLKTSKEELAQILEDRKIEFKEGFLKDFLVLKNIKNIENLDLFKDGFFTIQDEEAGLIALIMDPKPNEKILDACSSPGGKTTYMAELMKNKGEILACDLHGHRVNLVEKNAKRLGIDIIKTKCEDATVLNPKYIESFDKILLDVPCLGLGVLKRKPDIKWRRKKEDIVEICKIQEKILETCSKYVKPNGQIVYSTCSIIKDENDKIIENFLEKNKNFDYIEIDIKNYINKDKCSFFADNINIENENNKIVEKCQKIQLFQDEENDGFFICKIQKK